MIVDVLRRYLLIVWNFFFGQISSESIQDGPSADVVPPAEVDSNDDEIADDDDVIEIFDDEEDEGDEEDEEDEEDENVEVDVPKAPERKVVINDVPAKPSDPVKKTEDVPEVPKVKDSVVIEKPELPKDVEIKEKPKTDSDIPEKKETPTSKPEFEIIEREASKAIPEGDTSKLQPDFEIIERETGPKAVPEKDASKSKPEVEIKGKEAPEVVPDTPKPKDDVKTPEKAAAHVKFEDDEIRVPAKSPAAADAKHAANATAPRDADGDANASFVVLEKGEAAAKNADGPRETDRAIDAFLSGEQKHSGRLQHPESIQDQQLDYSDSGEELSDDDIEIDYEDDEDEEEVEEVKPLPPVARNVYKKND